MGRGERMATKVSSDEFHKGFLKGKLPPEPHCALCFNGVKRIKLRHGYIHYSEQRIIIKCGSDA